MLSSREALEALAVSGVDFVGVDVQHGAHDFRDAIAAIQLLDILEVESLVRIAELELELIPRYLDFGASGVIVAMIEDAATAERAVSLARYQPDGIRSYGGRRYGLSTEPDDLRQVRPAVYAMIETKAAVERLEEIAAVHGLAGLFVGPVDLALALGGTGRLARRLSAELSEPRLDPQPTLTSEQAAFAEPWREALHRVVDVAHASGIEAGTFAIGGDDARYWAAAGFDRVVVSSDIALLRGALDAELTRLRAGG